MDDKNQYALDERGSSFPPPEPAGEGDSADGVATAMERAETMATEDGQVGTLSEPDKVKDAVVPPWTKFADLNIEQKFEQARGMDFEVRDAYLRERCRSAKMEVACAASALDRATAIIETNSPFFIVHFEEMDAQGHRSDLSGKVLGKTEWLRQNVPDISKGTFYAALHAVKSRNAEQTRLMLGGVVPQLSNGKTLLTELQKEVVQALIDQGYKKKDAVAMTKAATGGDFKTLFRSAINNGLPAPPSNSPAPTPPESPAPTPAVVMVDPPVSASQGGDEKPISKMQAPAQIAELEQLKQENAELQKQWELAKAENASLLRQLEALQVPEKIKDDQITASLAAEPDRDVASNLLTEHLRAHASQFANGRIIIEAVSASIKFSGRDDRILPGDWLEKREKDSALTLCKCVGVAEFMKRRKVREWSEGKWGKEHVVFNDNKVQFRVISEQDAQKLAPEAFHSLINPVRL